MLITIKAISEELKEDGNPKHIEWEAVSADGKEIKVKLYPSIKIGEEWYHFEDRWDEFKNALNKSYDIERASIKQDGGRVWKPIIKATEVKSIFEKKAIEQVQTNREQSIECQVAVKEIGEGWRCGKFSDDDPLVEIYKLWLKVHIHGEVKSETKKDIPKVTSKVRQETLSTEWSKEEWSKNLKETDAGEWLRLWLVERSIGWTSDLKELLNSMSAKCQDDLKAEVERRLK